MMWLKLSDFFQMSAISVGCEEAYKTSVDVTCDTVDSSIKVTVFSWRPDREIQCFTLE